jgi:hypothetical protein
VEVAQQLAWLGSAIQTSPYGEVGRSQCHISDENIGYGPCFLMWFYITPIEVNESSCWHELFVNPVIAHNFPIEKRHFGKGLEIPIHMMAALCGASQAVEFDGGIVIKGFSSMLVPLERREDSVQWHCLRKEDDDTRFPYAEVNDHCPGRALLENVDFDSLTTTRAFLGWWGNTTSHLGTVDAKYKSIEWSDTKEPSKPVLIQSMNLGFSYFGTAQATFALGPKDGKLHISQTGRYRTIIRRVSRKPIILYDTSEKRGWLVPASAVIAHIAQTRQHRHPFRISGNPVEFTATDCSLDICEGAEQMLLINAKVKLSPEESGQGEYLFKDLVNDIWGLIEILMDKDIKMDLTSGIQLNGLFTSKLRGWEFMDVVEERSPIRLKETDIQGSNGGWIDLARDLNSVVLFGTGFEDLIRPAEGQELCHLWQRVPINKDYLTASVSMLNTLYEEAGSADKKEHLTSTHLQWHRGAALFETCPNSKNCQCSCDRLQQIMQKSVFTLQRITPPGPLKERGAVIFGKKPSGRLSKPSIASLKTRPTPAYSHENVPFLHDAATTQPPISGPDSSGSITTHPSLAGVATSLPEQERVLSNSYAILHPRLPLNDRDSKYSVPPRGPLQGLPEGSCPSQRRSIPQIFQHDQAPNNANHEIDSINHTSTSSL